MSSLRVAYFPDAYYEIDGVAHTSRHFEAFARERGLPFLMVVAGPRNEVITSGSVTRIELERGPVNFPLDRAHRYDLLFQRHRRRLTQIVREFDPDIIQITGPTDVGTLGAMISHKLHIPLAASWQTNLPLYARSRMAQAVSFLPEALSQALADAAEHWSRRATIRFYKWPGLLFAPNPELVDALQKETGKPCFLMSHSVDTEVFSPKFRDRRDGKFRIGYVGRLTPEKNVRWLAQLESELLAKAIAILSLWWLAMGRKAPGSASTCTMPSLRACLPASPFLAHLPIWMPSHSRLLPRRLVWWFWRLWLPAFP